MRLFATLLCLVAVAATLPQSTASMLVEEDFESYADTAAMTAVWTGALGTLSTDQAFSGSQSAFHPGGTVNVYSPGFGTIDATATQDILLSARIYDDAQGAADRMTVGLRGAPFPLFEMGRYNGPDFYAIRATLFSNDINANWVNFVDDTGAPLQPVAGWHSYEARFSLSGLTVTLDLLSNGTIDGTIFLAGNGSPYGGFSDLRFGGPSNLASAGPGYFDDITLALVAPVPEPASIVVCLLAATGLCWLRRR
jgi:hypothetical protein